MSYVRCQALVLVALDNWRPFDTWCMLHGIMDPWSIPSYKFIGLVIAWLEDDKTEESLNSLHLALDQSDFTPHPFLSNEFRRPFAKRTGRDISESEPLIKDEAFDELPVEERKRREARDQNKPFIVPSWWKGEKANYEMAKSMMGVQTKIGGDFKE